MIYFFLFLAGLFLGKMFYFNINFILYFYAILFVIFLFYSYAIGREQNEKNKIFYVPIENENEKNEEEIPIIRY